MAGLSYYAIRAGLLIFSNSVVPLQCCYGIGFKSLNCHFIIPGYFAVGFIPIIDNIEYNAAVDIHKTNKIK